MLFGETLANKMLNYVKGVGSIAFLMSSVFFGCAFIYAPLFPIMFLWPWLYRRIVEITASMWQTILVTVTDKIFGIKIVVTGDAVNHHEKTVILMNHRTRLDWFYFISYIFHSRLLNRHKIALKSVLKWIPGLGWAMQVAGYIFLDRNWETDQNHIEKILSYFVELQSKHNILFFPEGTDLSDSNKQRSKNFARKNNLPEFEYVLHPRKKGFTHFVNTLRCISGIHAVHDVTVAYPCNIPQAELDILKGNVPKEVHFYIKRYDISELPVDDDKLGEWCLQRWIEKEERLRELYSQEGANRRFKSKKVPPTYPRTFELWFAFAFWIAITAFFIHLTITYPIARWWLVMAVLFYISQSLFFGGVEKLELSFFETFHKPSHLWGKGQNSTGLGQDGAGDANRSKSHDVYEKYLKS